MSKETQEFLEGLVDKYEQFPEELEKLYEKIFVAVDTGMLSQDESVLIWTRILTILGSVD